VFRARHHLVMEVGQQLLPEASCAVLLGYRIKVYPVFSYIVFSYHHRSVLVCLCLSVYLSVSLTVSICLRILVSSECMFICLLGLPVCLFVYLSVSWRLVFLMTSRVGSH